MGFYRVGELMVHVKLTGKSKQTPHCKAAHSWKHGNHCMAMAGLLCDWKVSKTETCDLPICADHAQMVGENKHLCPIHQEAYRQWLSLKSTS